MKVEDTSLSAETIKIRALSGAKIMIGRTAISFLLRMVSSLALARLLFPKDYGAFGMVSGITGIGLFLCDVGMGSALMHQASQPTEDENYTVFVSQQAITAVIVSVIVLGSPWIVQIYRMPAGNIGLLICMAASLFLSSLRVIPMMALERGLRFRDIAHCELLENIVQVVVTIGMAYCHFGAWSLVGGGVSRGVTGLVCVWAASPWRPRGAFRFQVVRQLASFGVPIQLSALVPALAGNWCLFTVSRLLDVSVVGYVGWAMNIAAVPMMFAGVLNRVAFPAYSRLQSDPAMMCHYLKATMRRLFAVCCLTVPVAVALCPVILPLLFKQRWVPAVPLVQWFILDSAVAMLLIVLCTAQNALGYPGDRLGVTLLMMAVRWGLGYAVVARFGIGSVGPVILLFSLMEMVVTLATLAARNKDYQEMWAVVLTPLVEVSAILAASVWFGGMLAHHIALVQGIITLTLFFACILVCERLMPRSFVWEDVRQLIHSLHVRRNEKAL